MKLEVGKYYKSRDGRKWKCVHEYHKQKDYFFSNLFLMVPSDSDDAVMRLWDNGKYLACGAESDSDIISEWVEPVVHEYEMALLKMKSTDGREFISLQNISSIAPWDNSSIIARKTITITEGEGL